MHPFYNILHIYSPNYSRNLRVMDFFLQIYMSCFFQLLHFSNSENSELVIMSNDRLVENRGKGVLDLNVTITQVI